MADAQFVHPFVSRSQLDFGSDASFRLDIDVWANAGDNLFLSGFTKYGIFSFQMNPTTDGVINQYNFAIPDIPIACSVHPGANDPHQGEIYAIVHLTINRTKMLSLMSGYVNQMSPLSWPYGLSQYPLAPHGAPESIAGANPAAGAEVDETVPENQVWLLHAVQFALVTDSQAANRRVHLVISPEGNGPLHFFSNTDHTASLTRNYTCSPVGVVQAETAADDIVIAIPNGLLLPNFTTIETITDNIQTGDNYGVPRLFIERFLIEHA